MIFRDMLTIGPAYAGAIEVYYDYGTRTIPVPAGRKLTGAAEEAVSIWEGEGRAVRVRVLKRLEDGSLYCICHLPPEAEPPK